MDDWLLAVLFLALMADPGHAARVHCEVTHAAVDVALGRLQEVLADAPFSGLDYDLALQPPSSQPTAGGLGPAGYQIAPTTLDGRPGLSLRAQTPVGLAYGILRVVRRGLADPSSLGTATIEARGAIAVREVYEERGWDDPAAAESYKARLRWLFEEGYNRLDVPFGWWMPPPADLVDPANYHRKWDPAFDTARQVIAYAHSLGIQVFLVENPQFSPYFGTPPAEIREPYRSQPRPLSGEAYMLCPSEPANVALSRRRAEYLYRQLSEADGIVVYFGDPGGCPCAKCNPWGQTILRLCRDLYAPLLAEVAPRWQMTVTLWGVPRTAVAWVADHLDDFPRVVSAWQIPPNAPSAPYLVYDVPMVQTLVQVAAKRQVIMQQFLDGVGYRYGWVNFIEHPMPAMMERSLRASRAGGHLAGVYASAFDCYTQRVGTRLIGEWGLNPERPARDILAELGAEWFGPACGPDFAAAMAAMERYWDIAYDQFFADGPTEGHAASGPIAQAVRRALGRVSRHTVRNRERLATFVALGEAMALTSRQASARAEAARLSEAEGAQAAKLLRTARRDSERIVKLLSTGPYAYLPQVGYWGSSWVIGKRPAVIARELALPEAPGEWEPVVIPDGDFRQHSWNVASVGRVEWAQDATHGGCARLDNSQAEGTWSAIASPPITVKPDAPFRLDFDVRRRGDGGILWAQWLGADGTELSTRMMIEAPGDGRWHPALLRGITPASVHGDKLMLRFVLVWPAKEATLADLKLWQKAPLPRPPAG